MTRQVSFNTFALANADPDLILPAVFDSGYGGVGLYSEHAVVAARQDLRGRCSGLFILALSAGMLSSAVNRILKTTRMCSRYGIPAVVVLPTADWLDVTGWHDCVATVLGEAAHRSRDLGVSLLVEPVSSKLSAYFAVTEIESVERMLDQLQSSQIGWVLDLDHIEIAAIAAMSQRTTRRVRIVQLPAWSVLHHEDPVRFSEAKSAVDAIDASGFRGWWDVELIENEFYGTTKDDIESVVNASWRGVRSLLDI